MVHTPPKTVIHALHERANHLTDRPALWSHRLGGYFPSSWRQIASHVVQLTQGLIDLGLDRGDRVAIVSSNREEAWLFTLAAMASGAVAVPLHPRAGIDRIEAAIGQAKCRVLVLEDEAAWGSLSNASAGREAVRHTLVLAGKPAKKGVGSYQDLLDAGRRRPEGRYWTLVDRLDPQSPAVVIRGSDGEGVVLSHRNLCWMGRRLADLAQLEDEVFLAHLPLSEIGGQLLGIYLPIVSGGQVHFPNLPGEAIGWEDQSAERMIEDLRRIRPTVFGGGQRIWEKLAPQAEQAIGGQRFQSAKLIAWARQNTWSFQRSVLENQRASISSRASHWIASRTIHRQLRSSLGLDRCRLPFCGSGVLAPELSELFASLDLPIFELYCCPEASGPVAANLPEAIKLGTVGRPLAGLELRIDGRGAIFVRGQNVCLGHVGDPQATSAVGDSDWLRLVEQGELDSEGFLRIKRSSRSAAGVPRRAKQRSMLKKA